MSLINKMLQDLEARETSARAAEPRPAYRNLYAARPPVAAPPRTRLGFVLALVMAGVGAALWSMWQYMGPDFATVTATTSRPATTRRPVAVTAEPAVAAASGDAQGSVPAHGAAAQAGAAGAPKASEPAVVAANSAKKTAAVASSAEKPVVAKPAAGKSANGKPADQPVSDRKHNDIKTAAPIRRGPPAATRPVSVTPGAVVITERQMSAPERAQSAYQEGVSLLASQRPAEAERAWRSALELDPQHRAAREQLAGLLLGSGRADEAQVVLERGIAATPSYPGFVLLLARIDVDRGREAEAVAVLEQALTRTAGDADVAAFLAALHQRAGRHAEAVQRYQEAIARRPAEGRWWVGLGISQEARQDWRAAREAYTRALNTRLTPELARYAEQRLAGIR